MKALFYLFCGSLTALLFFQSCTNSNKPVRIPSTLKWDVNIISNDSMEGRSVGSIGERRAANYIAGRFGNHGLKQFGDSAYFQDFTFRPRPAIRKHGESDSARLALTTVQSLTGRNVLGAIDVGADKWVVIAAHYDHLGWGDENSLAPSSEEIHRGADDNASGVAALIELADRFYNSRVSHNILFAAFSGEEKGLIGSKHFIENATIPMEQVSYMLNMDMVGRMNSERSLAIYGTGTSPAWPEAIEIANSDSLKLLFHESGVGPSDHTSFYLADIPVLHFFTGQHEDYHKPTDLAEKINFEGLFAVINYVERVVRQLDGAEKLEFTKTKDQSNDDTPRFKVTLGVVPDYMFEGTGMRLDGVSEERPAHKAGLIKGDIIKRLGDIEVKDMYDYMGALGEFAAGDTTAVIVARGEAEKEFEVIWD